MPMISILVMGMKKEKISWYIKQEDHDGPVSLSWEPDYLAL